MSIYEGEYVNDKKDGYGVFRWASGNLYQGQFKDDERHGKGRMEWTDGSYYEGDWFRGIQHGYGKITFPDGSEKEGYFDNNVFIGKMKEDAGEFTPLDPERIFPVSGKLSKTKSVQKLTQRSFKEPEELKLEALVNKNRPKPLIKSKYTTLGSPGLENSPSKMRSSLPKLKVSSPLPLPKASKSARKFFSKRGNSQSRRLLKNSLV